MIEENIKLALEQLLSKHTSVHYPIELFVLGCSTSRVQGQAIGTKPGLEVGRTIVSILKNLLEAKEIHLAVQCCEHLNRALVIEREYALAQGYTIVSAIPHEKAGGSAATAAYDLFDDPVLVEHVQAQAGMDIGQTAIGMHIQAVQIPVHFDALQVGQASVFGLLSRPKLIGGARAKYE